MPIFELEFNPPFYLRNRHLQTILPVFFREKKDINYKRITITLPDNDFLDIDILNEGKKEAILLIHGLEGNSQSAYNKLFAKYFSNKLDFTVFLFHFRSCSGRDNHQIFTYHSGLTSDLHYAIEYLIFNSNLDKLHLIGVSLGGNTLIKYFSDYKTVIDKKIGEVLAISVPCDLSKSEKVIQKSIIYKNRLLKSLQKKALSKISHPQSWFTENEILNLQSIEQFDNLFTAKSFGYDTAQSYYKANSCKYYIKNIDRKVNMLLSKDDPFFDENCIPFQEATQNPNFNLYLTNYGGHVGFYTGLKSDKFLEMIHQILFQNSQF